VKAIVTDGNNVREVVDVSKIVVFKRGIISKDIDAGTELFVLNENRTVINPCFVLDVLVDGNLYVQMKKQQRRTVVQRIDTVFYKKGSTITGTFDGSNFYPNNNK